MIETQLFECLERSGVVLDQGELEQMFSIFSSAEGQKLLEILCMFRHPMASRFEGASDPIDAARRDGQTDLVSFLWRWGSGSSQPPISALSANQTTNAQP
jgi:hypothetical protein